MKNSLCKAMNFSEEENLLCTGLHTGGATEVIRGMGCENEESKVRTMERVGSPLSMILVQILSTGMFLLSKLVLDGGRFIFAILTYRCIVGALFVLPFALVMERKKWSEVNWIAGFWIFCNALTGITAAMALYYYGLRDTNATYGASFLNLVPVVTFLFAVLMRLERLGSDSRGGRIKILGTLLCLGGAMVLSMYVGLTFHIPSLHLGANGNKQITEAADHHTVRGTLFLVGSCISFSAWAIVQAKLLQVYPFKYCATMYTCIVASLQSLAFGWALNSKRSVWKLQWDLQLLLVLYSGALNTGAVFCLVSWVVAIKGPSYSAMFNALSLVLTTLLEAFFMTGVISLGSLVGITMLIGGLYAYLWGKGREVPQKQVRDEESILETSSIPSNGN